MDENCCVECGFTTTNLGLFTSHIEQHEEEQKHVVKAEWSSNSSESHTLSPLSTPPPSGSLESEEDQKMAIKGLDRLLTETPTTASDEEKLLCSSSSSSGSVSPNEGEITSITEAANALLNQTKLMGTVPLIIGGTPEPGSGKKNKAVHVCPHCNFTTYMSQHMKSHLEAHERHQGQMYQCDICQMQFSQKANMHRHRMRHSGVKPYECRYCKKRFFRKDQMQEHSMTHIKTGADFDCPVAFCTLQFSQHSALRAHLDEKHNITSTSPASCKRCSLLFANSRRLLLHYQTKHDEGDTSNISAAIYDGADSPVSSPPKKRRTSSGSSLGNLLQPSITPIPSSLTSASSLFSIPPSVITSLASQNNNHLALLQSRIEEMVKMNGLGALSATPSMDAVSVMQTFAAQQAAAAEAAKMQQAPLSPEFDQQTSTFSLTSEDLLLALSNQATSSLFSVDPLSSAKESLRLWSGEQLSAFTAPSEEASHSPSIDSADSVGERDDDMNKEALECNLCDISYKDKTLYLLHKGLHSEQDPWKCNLCGHCCGDRYMFTTHMISADHSS